MSVKKIIIIAAACLMLLPGTPVMAASSTMRDISQALVCQCGCTLTVANCTHIECKSRETMTTVIKDKLALGQSGDEIIQFFVAQYGEQVLASPPKKGFNLVAWLLPFASILVGAGIIYFAIKKWVMKGKHAQDETRPETEESDDVYQKRLEQELKDFTEVGFR